MASLFQDQSSIPEKTLLRKRLIDEHLESIGGPVSKRSRNARLMAGSHYSPKESKEKPLGEDAHFICEDEQTIGIADGVGGYAKHGIDSGEYARELMDKAFDFVLDESINGVDPMRVLDYAFVNCLQRGGSTACIITVKDNAVHAVNLGDSGFMIIRGGEIVYRTSAQQCGFNRPLQLGQTSPYRPSDGEEIGFEVELGDVIVAATDGLFDNMFDNEIEGNVGASILRGDSPEIVAANLVEEARRVSLQKNCVTPFTVAAFDHGLDEDDFMGGKYDDITVVIGLIY